MKKINILILIYFFLVSCGGIKDAGKVLRNEKIRTTDEFLIEKKNPLVLPPNFEEIPEPGSVTKKKETENNNFKKILKSSDTKKKIGNKSSSVEETILDRIRK